MHAVIFDVDGTLLQSTSEDDKLYRSAVESVVGPVRFRDSLVDYDFTTDAGILLQLLDDNGIPNRSHMITEIKAQFIDALTKRISVSGPFLEVPGARRFLEALRASRSHSVAIATGGWRETAHLKLRSARFGIDGIPVASSNDGIDRADIMLTALSRLGSGFDTVTYYGDGAWDHDAAERLGWQFVAVGPALGGLLSFVGASVS